MTAAPRADNVDAFEVYRLSELCGLEPSVSPSEFSRLDVGPKAFGECHAERLTNMNAASLYASAALLGRWGAGAANSSRREAIARRYVPSFVRSVVARSCVLRRDEPFAEYVGCNGVDTQHYVCAPCNNLIDRCVGEQRTADCELTPPYPCRCSDEAIERSALRVGRLGLSFPNLMTLAPRREYDRRRSVLKPPPCPHET